MAKHKKRVIGPCAYCGTIERLTEDHVIPRCLYIDKKVPADIPVVHACRSCNNAQKNLDDSYLRDLLVMDNDASPHPIAQHIFHNTVLRAASNVGYIQSPVVLLARQGNGVRVPIYTAGGIYLGDGFSPNIPEERTHRIFATIVRGLYRYYVDKPIPAGVQFDVMRYRDRNAVSAVVQSLVAKGAAYRRAGDGQVFQCLYGVAGDRPDTSVWLLEFYRSALVVVFTRPGRYPSVEGVRRAELIQSAVSDDNRRLLAAGSLPHL